MKNLSILTLLAILLVSCAPESTAAPVHTATNVPLPALTTAFINTATKTPLPLATLTSVPIATFTPRPTITPQVSTIISSDCTQDRTRLSKNLYAKVSGAETDPPNRVRGEPSKTSSVVAQIYPGTIVKIIDGPVCADNLVFWKVENANIPNGAGWTAEGDGVEYWLEPYVYMPEFVSLSAYNVNFSVPASWSSIPNSEIVLAGSDDWCKWPKHIKITLTSYPAQSEWKPIIYVYETKQMRDWYPICPGAPLLRVRQHVLSHGERVLFGSKNAQPIFNSELIYGYSGKTPDEQYTIIVFFPVNFPFLAYSRKNLTLPPGGIPFDLDNQNWDTYYQSVGMQLEAATDLDFNPNLNILDEIVESIAVTEP